mmetsp:Transcript_16401/g.50183  ORF Transcript_16401/g.50183 Transcript_16401/m.50183 type:complete len:250 (-) Transcript_16401:4877-5626(-)
MLRRVCGGARATFPSSSKPSSRSPERTEIGRESSSMPVSIAPAYGSGSGFGFGRGLRHKVGLGLGLGLGPLGLSDEPIPEAEPLLDVALLDRRLDAVVDDPHPDALLVLARRDDNEALARVVDLERRRRVGDVVHAHDAYGELRVQLEGAPHQGLARVEQLVVEEEEAVGHLLAGAADLDEVALADEGARAVEELSAAVDAASELLELAALVVLLHVRLELDEERVHLGDGVPGVLLRRRGDVLEPRLL